jgi:hypothetical protein
MVFSSDLAFQVLLRCISQNQTHCIAIIKFDLWMFKTRFDIFSLVVNFIDESIGKACYCWLV